MMDWDFYYANHNLVLLMYDLSSFNQILPFLLLSDKTKIRVLPFGLKGGIID